MAGTTTSGKLLFFGFYNHSTFGTFSLCWSSPFVFWPDYLSLRELF